jgi:hypothetical protein
VQKNNNNVDGGDDDDNDGTILAITRPQCVDCRPPCHRAVTFTGVEGACPASSNR